MIKENFKATAIILGAVIALIAIVTIPLIISRNQKEDEENFPDYSNTTFKDSDFADPSSENYIKIKKKLENDSYFKRETLISNYNYKNYTGEDLKPMIWNYIFSYELTNTRYLSNFKRETGKFCMRSHYVVNSFKELYNVNISKSIEYLQGYVDYVSYSNNVFCFNFDEVASEYNNNIKILIDGIESRNSIIKANVYVYEFYTSDTEAERSTIYYLDKVIDSSNYKEASDVVLNDLNGKVTHKQLQFKINNNAKFFKYQILSSKNLDY